MTDLITRLRTLSRPGGGGSIGNEAADEIERLRACLRDAMNQAVEYDGLDVENIGPQHWYTAACATLKEKK